MQEQAPPNDVYLMLVKANVLRLRRQYELAEAQCSEVLEMDPDNAAAHSVLGDIARDRNHLPDAIQWYKAALDLNPGNVADRKKLEAVIERAYSRKKVIERISHDVKERLGSTADEIRAARIPSALSVTLAVMVAIIMLVTLLVLVVGRRGDPAQTGPVERAAAGGFETPQSGVLEPKPIATDPEADPAASAPKFEEDIAPLEAGLLDELRLAARVVDPQCELSGVQIDPKGGLVSVECSMPRVWSVENTRDGILRVGVRLAIAAAQWDERIPAVRLRCNTRQDGQPDRLALVAEADAQELLEAGRHPETADPTATFASIWWDPQLRPEVQAPPSPGVR